MTVAQRIEKDLLNVSSEASGELKAKDLLVEEENIQASEAQKQSTQVEKQQTVTLEVPEQSMSVENQFAPNKPQELEYSTTVATPAKEQENDLPLEGQQKAREVILEHELKRANALLAAEKEKYRGLLEQQAKERLLKQKLKKIYAFIKKPNYRSKYDFIQDLKDEAGNEEIVDILNAAMKFLDGNYCEGFKQLYSYLLKEDQCAKCMLGWILANSAETIDACVTHQGTQLYIPFKNPYDKYQLIAYTLSGTKFSKLKGAQFVVIENSDLISKLVPLETAVNNYTTELIARLKEHFSSSPNEKSKNIELLLNVLKSQRLNYKQIIEVFHNIQHEDTFHQGANPVAKFFLGKQVTSSWSAAWKEIKEMALEKLLEEVKNAPTKAEKINLLMQAKELELFKSHRNESYFRGFGKTHSVQVIEKWLKDMMRMKEDEVLRSDFFSSGLFIHSSPVHGLCTTNFDKNDASPHVLITRDSSEDEIDPRGRFNFPKKLRH